MADTLSKYINTLVHLRPVQIWYQLRNRIWCPRYRNLASPAVDSSLRLSAPVVKPSSYDGGTFTFLNVSDTFTCWDDTRHGMLWAYNLNYMDWLLQEGMTFETGAFWIDRFIDTLADNKVGLDPYPSALRIINWIKFISAHFDAIDSDRRKRWNDSLYSQYIYLSERLEYHLLGNHILEDAYALFIASVYFSDRKMHAKASALLREQLDQQVLPDGAHFEQSPMYHCIMLERLLDCCNVSSAEPFLRDKVAVMLGHLDSILYADGTYPMFNDSADGVAPEPKQIFEYASRLGIEWERIPLRECGYRHMQNEHMEMFADAGNVAASYQPGHAHADTFTYELRMDGHPFIVDTGISTYEKNERRLYERGTMAHNTIVIDGKDSSQVWGGFRLGHRAEVTLIHDEPDRLTASHDGYGKDKVHTRTFAMYADSLSISDVVPSGCTAVSYIHFSPDVAILSFSKGRILTDRGVVEISGADDVEVQQAEVSRRYSGSRPAAVAMVRFVGSMSYTIKKN